MVTMQSWMFLSSFEKLRGTIMKNQTITTLMHMENMVLGIAFGTAVSVLKNEHIAGYKGTYNHIKLEDIEDGEPKDFPIKGNRFAQVSSDNFEKIPGAPVAYWVNKKLITAFGGNLLRDYGATKQGFATGDNDTFLRVWNEVDFCKIGFNRISCEDFLTSRYAYAPCNKGGDARKWYGNNIVICKFDKKSYEQLAQQGNHLPSRSFYFKEGITWSALSSGFLTMRFSPIGYVFETKGSRFFAKEPDNLKYLLALMNSKVAMLSLQILCPTIDFHEGPVSKVPVVLDISQRDEVLVRSNENIRMSKDDWDSYETSWDFKRHPLI